MHLQDAETAVDVGPVDHHAPVEAAGAQQRRVQHVRAVGGGDEDHALVGLEAVHLDQELVERLLALVVAAAQAGAAMAADGVDLVDEDDAGSVLLALLEEVAHPARADADEHLHEVRSGDREERHVGLTRNRAREQGLAGAGRAHQQEALGISAELLELLRVLQVLDDLEQLVLRLFDAGDVLEGDLLARAREEPRLALAERERAVASGLHLAHEEDPQPDDQQDRPPREQDREERVLALRLGVDLHLLAVQPLDQVVVVGAR